MISTLDRGVLIKGEQMLSERLESILRIIVGEYIFQGNPVASETIARGHGLGVSSATVRNEVARLEEEGYIVRPHPSAGGIPSDKGYRYYVESLAEETALPMEERLMISHLFHQVEREQEQWTRLAAALLARMVRNLAIVTTAKAFESRLKRLELVAVQDFLALLILLLRETRLKQQLITFDEAISQEELTIVSNKLNAAFGGLTRSQIMAQRLELSPAEKTVTKALVHVMQGEDEQRYEEPQIEGLCHVLTQPEFASSERMMSLIEMLESGRLVRSILPQVVVAEGVQVIIGAENREDAMLECSMVVTQYGIPGEVSGALGVLGPTRMQYGRAISAVRYMGSLMSELVAELCGGGCRPGNQN